MDDAAAVRVVQRLRDLTGEDDRLRHRELPLPVESGAQRFAVHQRHHIVEHAVCRAGVVEGKNVRMLHARGDPNLAEEPLMAEGGGDLRAEDLQGNGTVVLQVPRAKHQSHPTAAQLGRDRVALREGSAQPIQSLLLVHSSVAPPPPTPPPPRSPPPPPPPPPPRRLLPPDPASPC